MSRTSSEYYPPRANWRSPLRVHVTKMGQLVRAILRPINFGEMLGWRDTVLSLLLPGYAMRRLGFPKLGMIITAIYSAAGLIFLICLGYAVANLCFGLMLSLHVTSILFVLRHLNPDWNIVVRLIASVLILMGVSGMIYLPFRHSIEKYAMPLRTKDKVIIVNTRILPEKLTRGNWVAYHIPEISRSFQNSQAHGTMIVREGFSLGKIVGLPGDVVRFSETDFSVHGQKFLKMPGMPANTEMVVPEKHWFIWPDLAVTASGAGASLQLEEFLKKQSLVAQSDFAGQPFARWFFHKQKLP